MNVQVIKLAACIKIECIGSQLIDAQQVIAPHIIH